MTWTPFIPDVNAKIHRMFRALGDVVLVNNLYRVYKRVRVDMVHLEVSRRDNKPIHNWRHLQRIKNELVGPEAEGAELYPAESRLQDVANTYHLWVYPDKQFPFGYPCKAPAPVYKEVVPMTYSLPFPIWKLVLLDEAVLQAIMNGKISFMRIRCSFGIPSPRSSDARFVDRSLQRLKRQGKILFDPVRGWKLLPQKEVQ